MKAILVIDKPESCDDCPLMHSYFDNGYGWVKECIGSGENDCIVFNKKIEDYCPLKPLPRKKEVEVNKIEDIMHTEFQTIDVISDKYIANIKLETDKLIAIGYNGCIDEILGE